MDEHDKSPAEEEGHDYSFDIGKNAEELGFGYLFFRYLGPIIFALIVIFFLGFLLVGVASGG